MTVSELNEVVLTRLLNFFPPLLPRTPFHEYIRTPFFVPPSRWLFPGLLSTLVVKGQNVRPAIRLLLSFYWFRSSPFHGRVIFCCCFLSQSEMKVRLSPGECRRPRSRGSCLIVYSPRSVCPPGISHYGPLPPPVSNFQEKELPCLLPFERRDLAEDIRLTLPTQFFVLMFFLCFVS